MKYRFLALFLFLFSNIGFAQGPVFNIKYSEPLAVFVFVKKQTSAYGNNVFKDAFTASRFNTPEYKKLITDFESLSIDYTYQYAAYPYGSKIPGMTESLLQKNLVSCKDLTDFKLRSVGLVANHDLIELTKILAAFVPVYNELIYRPNKETFEKKLDNISKFVVTKKISDYFETGLVFYNSNWDNTIPFEIAFYPMPPSQGFTATAFYNCAASAIEVNFEDYDVLLSVMLHEIFHILYDEQSLEVKNNISTYFKQHPSKCSNYAYLLLNEALATVMGNGYVFEKMIGEPDTGVWYNKKYINLMAKQIYPTVKEYISQHKPIDKAFIDTYIDLYQQHYAEWINEPANTMNYRYTLCKNREDIDYVDHLYHAAMSEAEDEITAASIDRMKATPLSKLIIVSEDNTAKLSLIKSKFPELKQWKYNAGTAFVYTVFLNDRSQLYIINQTKSSLEDLFKKIK